MRPRRSHRASCSQAALQECTSVSGDIMSEDTAGIARRLRLKQAARSVRVCARGPRWAWAQAPRRAGSGREALASVGRCVYSCWLKAV